MSTRKRKGLGDCQDDRALHADTSPTLSRRNSELIYVTGRAMKRETNNRQVSSICSATGCSRQGGTRSKPRAPAPGLLSTQAAFRVLPGCTNRKLDVKPNIQASNGSLSHYATTMAQQLNFQLFLVSHHFSGTNILLFLPEKHKYCSRHQENFITSNEFQNILLIST